MIGRPRAWCKKCGIKPTNPDKARDWRAKHSDCSFTAFIEALR